jgi:SAM-dependent methyltransferase
MIPIDVNVYSPDEFRDELEDEFGFARCVTERQGRLVYSRTLGDFSDLSKKWDAEPSPVRHARLRASRGEWQLYQTGYARMLRGWPEPPWAIAAAELRERADWRVADFGCGDGALARAIPNPTISFDHLAGANVEVTAGDLASVPLDADSVDAVVLSLSLIGENWRDYLREAARVTRDQGLVYVTELADGPRSKSLVAATETVGLAVDRVTHRGPFVCFRLGRARRP